MITPSGQRRILAAVTLVTALAGAFLGLVYRVGSPAAAIALTLSSGVFTLAGWTAWRARSPREGSGPEIEALRSAGRGIVRQARIGALGMFASSMILISRAPQLSGDQVWEVLAVGSVALLISLHVYGRAYPAFDLPPPESWIESLPAAPTPGPEPEPGLRRLLTRKNDLQARGYR